MNIDDIVDRQEEKEKLYNSDWTPAQLRGVSISERIKTWSVEHRKDRRDKYFVKIYYKDTGEKSVEEIIRNNEPDKRYSTTKEIMPSSDGFCSVGGSEVRYKRQYVPIAHIKSTQNDYSKSFVVKDETNVNPESSLEDKIESELLVNNGEYILFEKEDYPSEIKTKARQFGYLYVGIMTLISIALAILYTSSLPAIAVSYLVMSVLGLVLSNTISKPSSLSDYKISDGSMYQKAKNSVIKENIKEPDQDENNKNETGDAYKNADVEVTRIEAKENSEVIIRSEETTWTFEPEEDKTINKEIKDYILDNKQTVKSGSVVLIVAELENESQLSKEWFTSDDGKKVFMFPNEDISVSIEENSEFENKEKEIELDKI